MDYDIIACSTLESSTCYICIKIKDSDVGQVLQNNILVLTLVRAIWLLEWDKEETMSLVQMHVVWGSLSVWRAHLILTFFCLHLAVDFNDRLNSSWNWRRFISCKQRSHRAAQGGHQLPLVQEDYIPM